VAGIGGAIRAASWILKLQYKNSYYTFNSFLVIQKRRR
jgi:hypothetical protein